MALRAWSQDAEGTSGLSGAQLFVLQHLADAAAPSLNDLARRTMTSKAAVSVVVARLVGRSFVRRAASPRDGRRIELALTSAGRQALARAPESPQGRLLAGLHALPKSERTALAAHLERFVAALGLSALEPPMLFEPPIDTAATRRTVRPPAPRRRQPATAQRHVTRRPV